MEVDVQENVDLGFTDDQSDFLASMDASIHNTDISDRMEVDFQETNYLLGVTNDQLETTAASIHDTNMICSDRHRAYSEMEVDIPENIITVDADDQIDCLGNSRAIIQTDMIVSGITMAFSHMKIGILDKTSPVVSDDQSVGLKKTNASIQTDMLGRLPVCLPADETNFLRFSHLINKIAPAAVRHRFDKEFPPDVLEEIILKHKPTLMDLKLKRVINTPQWNLIFPGRGCSPTSLKFDITLMMCFFRHLTKISPKSGSFDALPPPSDVTIGADLARIRYHRNNIAHYLEKDRSIDNADFPIIWHDISEALNRIGGTEYAEQCSKLLAATLDSSHMDIYRDLCIEQQKMLKDPIPHNEREKINETILKWEERDTVFVETSASTDLQKMLLNTQFVIVTGGPGTGKSFTAQHVLLEFQKSGYDVIPVNSSSDMMHYFSDKCHQIFYIDDFCGRFNISNSDIEEWDRNRKQLTDILFCSKTKCIYTCRSQIYQDSKFKCLNFDDFKVLDLSGTSQLSLIEKRNVARNYLGKDVLESLTDETIHHSLCFPLLCYLYKEHTKQSVVFFEKPTTCFQVELSELRKQSEKLKYSCIAICVMLNNNVPLNVFTHAIGTKAKHIFDNVFEELEINVNTPQKIVKSQFDSMVKSYFTKKDSGYTTIHDYLFDICCCHVSETMTKCVINYADNALLSNRALFQSCKQCNETGILIQPEYEYIFFQRMMREIRDGNIVHVFGSSQMQYKLYRDKYISFLIQTNQKLNAVDSDGQSALHICSRYGYNDMIAILCDRGENVNHCDKDGCSPIYVASLEGHCDTVQLLCERGGNVNQCTRSGVSPLHVATEKGHCDIVKILCNRGRYVDKCTYWE